MEFQEAADYINKQLSFNPIKNLTIGEEAEITKVAVMAFALLCGDVPKFYVEAGPHGLVEIVLGEK